MNESFNEAYWRDTPEDQLIKDMQGHGLTHDQAFVAVNAVLNAYGRKSDFDAHVKGSGHWQRLQAAGSGTKNDPSPDSLQQAREEDAMSNEEVKDAATGGGMTIG